MDSPKTKRPVMKHKIAKLTIVAALMAANGAAGGERTIKITDTYLHIPVSHSRDRVRIVM